jgi:hypothetical protein
VIGRRVWADEDVQALARNFLCVADEVWTLDHVDNPASKFFKDFIKAASFELSWGPTTKQGVYAMTPEGDYLSGHVARHDKAATIVMLKAALAKWNDIVAKKGLKPKAIPPRPLHHTWDAQGLARNAGGDAGPRTGLILQVTVRDLPYKGERHPGPAEYRNWFNQTWTDFTQEELLSLLPKAGAKTPVPDALFRKLAKETLLDFVRGQTGSWSDGAIKKATLTVEPAGAKEGSISVRYQGEFHFEEGGRGFEGKLHGKALFDTKANRFRMFELVAAGMRHGKTENFRGDAPPSPIGLAFIIEDQYDKQSPAAETKPATASADKKPVPAAATGEWDAKLRTLVKSELQAGKRTTFLFKALGRPAEVLQLDDAGKLKLRSDGSEFPLPWTDLSIEDRRNLAVARIRESKPAEDLCLAAFYQLSCGDERAADALLKSVPAADADRVRSAFRGAQ